VSWAPGSYAHCRPRGPPVTLRPIHEPSHHIHAVTPPTHTIQRQEIRKATMIRKALLALPLALLAGPVGAYKVYCGGTGLAIEPGLEGVAGADLQDRTPLLDDGPNLVLNGDFSFGEGGECHTRVPRGEGLHGARAAASPLSPSLSLYM
jgi:hypothetical protein